MGRFFECHPPPPPTQSFNSFPILIDNVKNNKRPTGLKSHQYKRFYTDIPYLGIHKVYNFGKPFSGHYNYILSLSDQCLAVEKRIFKEINQGGHEI